MLELSLGPIAGKTAVYALLVLELHDGRTMQQLSWAGGWDKSGPIGSMLQGPYREVDTSWRIAPSAIPASGQHREAVEALVRAGLADTLPKVLAIERGGPAPVAAKAKSDRRPAANLSPKS